jgi:hypothetical protein
MGDKQLWIEDVPTLTYQGKKIECRKEEYLC